MYNFLELTDDLSNYTLLTYNNLQNQILEDMQIIAPTNHVKNLQMINLGKTAYVIGLFSIFESKLPKGVNSQYAFQEVENRLKTLGKMDLLKEFKLFYQAINSLKHGEGRSYNQLLNQIHDLDFSVKLPNQYFVEEGDVSEVDTLIQVDDSFILRCHGILKEIYQIVYG